MAKVGMSSPWVVFYREVQAFFKYDNEVNVVLDEEEREIKLYVNRTTKASALAKLLPEEKEFGNVTLKITVVPANGLTTVQDEDIFKEAFKNNPVLSYTRTFKGLFSADLTYIVFKNEVVQYFTDNLSDINGFESTLYQTIARDVFVPMDNVFYCTDITNSVVTCDSTIYKTDKTSLGKPLGEWP